MIIEKRVKEFEKLGFGMFVHFGPYSAIGKGEWSKKLLEIPDEEYEKIALSFAPDEDWAKQLVFYAKTAGCKYITLTTRHHDGFSLYDTCGLNDYDAVHSCGRDLIKEFVDACRSEDIIPFFYHTLLDWREKSYQENFTEYLKYLRNSVELLCTNYGKIGGIWFDGMWNKKDADWEEDKLYSMIRSHQPEVIIINNTGLGERGKLGHIELDSVTFERGKPGEINLDDSPKYVASEMCQVFGCHWGYTAKDLNYKSIASIVEDLCVCRRYGANFLLNVGPMSNGKLRNMDKAMFEMIGDWINIYNEAIRSPRPAEIEITGNEKDFILCDGNNYYYFAHDLPMISDPNVALEKSCEISSTFKFDKKITSAFWMDNGNKVDLEINKDNITLMPMPFSYGENLIVRVAKLEVE